MNRTEHDGLYPDREIDACEGAAESGGGQGDGVYRAEEEPRTRLRRDYGERVVRGSDILSQVERSVEVYHSRVYVTRAASVFLALVAFAVGILLSPWFLLVIVAAAVMFWFLEISLKPIAWSLVLSRTRRVEKVRSTGGSEYESGVNEQIRDLHEHLRERPPQDVHKIDRLLVTRRGGWLYAVESAIALLLFAGLWFFPLPRTPGFPPNPYPEPSIVKLRFDVDGDKPLAVPVALNVAAAGGAYPVTVPIAVRAGDVPPIPVSLAITSTEPKPVPVRFEAQVDGGKPVNVPVHIRADVTSEGVKPLNVPVQITPETTGGATPIKIPIEVNVQQTTGGVPCPQPASASPPVYPARYYRAR